MTLPKTKFPALSSFHLVNLFGIVSSITNATPPGPLTKNDHQGSNLTPASKKTSGFKTTDKQI